MAAERFDCFISYARSSSAQLAVDLQTGLERFAKPWNRLRAIRVFRDDSSMSANTALWSTIEKGLTEARWFVLLASPEAAHSQYVDQEVAWWVRHKGAHTLLLVRAAGTIAWDHRAHNFHPATDAIPQALRGAYAEEPRWVDMSWYGRPGSLGRGDGRFVENVADLSAAIRGIERDTLIGENVRQHRKTRRLTRAAVAALSVLLVLALAAGGLAWVQRSEAVRQRDAATEQSLISRARQLAATAVNDAQTDLQSAMLLAATAYKSQPEFQTEQALHAVVTTTPQLIGFFDFGEPVTFVDATPDGEFLVGGTESGKVYGLDRASGERTELMDLRAAVEFLAVSDDGKTVAASASDFDDKGLRSESRSALWQNGKRTDLAGERLVAMSPSGRTYADMPEQRKFDDPDIFEITSDGRQSTVTTPGTTTHWIELPNDNVIVSMNEYGNYMRATIDGKTVETTRTPMGTWMFGGNLSPDGNKFTYTNGAQDIEVWDLAGPLLPEYGDAALTARTADVQVSDLALNAGGTRMATSADGAIYVSEVRPRGQSNGFTQLRGAGAQPHSLRFLSDDLIVSASGSSAALWDLTKTTPLAAVTPADVGDTCSACWSPLVLPSKDAKTVLISNNFGVSVVNTETGKTAEHFDVYEPSSQVDGILGASPPPALAWLDEQRVFAYSPDKGTGWILHGDNLNEVDRHFDLPSFEEVTQVARRFDGSLVVIADETLVTIDPESGDFSVADPGADVVTPNGAYAVDFVPSAEEGKSTTVKVIDTENSQIVKSVEVEGTLLKFAAHTGDAVTLLRDVKRGKASVDTEMLRLPLDGDDVSSVGRLGDVIYAQNVTATSDNLYVEQNGVIGMYWLSDASRLGLLPVKSAVRSYNGVGVTPDAKTLVVASETTQTVMRVPVTADAWADLACGQAGRTLRKDDLSGVTSTDGLTAGCGSELPH